MATKWKRVRLRKETEAPYVLRLLLGGRGRKGREARKIMLESVFEPRAAAAVRARKEPGALAEFPVIFELEPPYTARSFAGELSDNRRLGRAMRMAPIYAHPSAGLECTRFATAIVKPPFFGLRHRDPLLRRAIRRLEIGAPIPLFPPAKPRGGPPVARAAPDLVVTGVIDDGIGFANARFRSGETATRIEYFWSQDGLPVNPPASFSSGWELDRAAIEALLANAAPAGGSVDEERVYRAANHIDFRRGTHQPAARRQTHGTHVMDIAAGFDPAAAPADRPIIGVQLPVATTADTSGATLAPYVLDAMRYILDRADRLSAKPLPVVVNLSYGLIAGPHDGSSILEAALDDLIAVRDAALENAWNESIPLRIVLPSGNSRQARCHAWFHLANNAHRALSWRILPDDRTPSFMEMWLPHVAGAQVEIEVTTPTGDTATIRAGEGWVWQPGASVLCMVLYLDTIVPGRNRPMIFFAVEPTATTDAGHETAPAGDWRIRVRNVGPAATIDAWIQRDDTPYGYPLRGRQSRFDDPDYVRYDYAGRVVDVDNPLSYVKRHGSMNSIATGKKPVVVGGFRRKDGHTLEYSAGGQTINSPNRGAPSNDGPDVMAVSEDSDAYSGVLACGTRSGTTVAMNGTSVAAPEVTRLIAERMAAHLPCDRAAIAALAELGLPPGMDPPPLPERGGAGRIFRPRDPRPHRRRYE